MFFLITEKRKNVNQFSISKLFSADFKCMENTFNIKFDREVIANKVFFYNNVMCKLFVNVIKCYKKRINANDIITFIEVVGLVRSLILHMIQVMIQVDL
jgi:hypothetical protein